MLIDSWNDACQGTQSGFQSETLSLFKNGAAYATIETRSAPFYGQGEFEFTPTSAIPDGSGGVLAIFHNDSSECSAYDTSSGATATLANTNCPTSSDNVVLGKNNTAFLSSGQLVVAFNAATLQQNWAYTSAGSPTLVAATDDDGVTIDDSQQGIIQLDENGNAGTPVSTLQDAAPFDMATWEQVINGDLSMIWSPSGSNGVPNTLADSPAPMLGENQYGQRRPPLCQNAKVICALAPEQDNLQGSFPPGVKERDIVYKAFYFHEDTKELEPLSGPARIAWNEELLSGASVVCSFPTTVCQNTPAQYNSAQAEDVLNAGSSGVATIKQTFFVDRGQVRVFWPSLQILPSGFEANQWTGALTQIATTYTNGPRIQQQTPDRFGVMCSADCDTTPP